MHTFGATFAINRIQRQIVNRYLSVAESMYNSICDILEIVLFEMSLDNISTKITKKLTKNQ